MLLKGTIYITNDINLCLSNLNMCKTIIIADEPDNYRIPQAVGGSLLLPPYEAMSALVDGEENIFKSIYMDYLNNNLSVYKFINIILQALIAGTNIILLIDREGPKFDMVLREYFISAFGIILGDESHQFQFDLNYIPGILNRLYSDDDINVEYFLRLFPEDMPFDPFIIRKMAFDTHTPFINDYENQLSELKGKLYNSKELAEDLTKKRDELNSLKQRGLELEENIKEVSDLLQEISESKRDMEREKEIYETQVNNLENEEKTLSKLEQDKHLIQNNLDNIRESEEKISRLEKYVSKLDVYLDFEKSVLSIQNLKQKEQEIDDKLESIAQQKQIVVDNKENYNKYLASEEEINKYNNQKINFEKELATMAKLENDKKDLLKEVQNERNEVNQFFAKAKDKLDDYGLDQDNLAKIDNIEGIEDATNNFLNEISEKIKSLSEDIIAKNEEIVVFKQNIKSSQKPLDDLEDADSKCPVCQADIDDNKKYYGFRYPDGAENATQEMKDAWRRFVSWMAHSNPQPMYEEHIAETEKEYKLLSNELNALAAIFFMSL